MADPTTFADAIAILDKYGITEPPAVVDHLRAAKEETPKPGDPRLARTELHMVATPQMSLEAAAEIARKAGITPVILGDAIEGEVARSRDGACRHRPPGQAPWAAGENPLRAAVRRRNHGDRARQGPRRPQRRIPAGTGGCPQRRAGYLSRSPATPMASTAPKTMPARSSLPIRWHARRHAIWTRRRCSPIMTATVFSPASATWSSPARR